MTNPSVATNIKIGFFQGVGAITAWVILATILLMWLRAQPAPPEQEPMTCSTSSSKAWA